MDDEWTLVVKGKGAERNGMTPLETALASITIILVLVGFVLQIGGVGRPFGMIFFLAALASSAPLSIKLIRRRGMGSAH